MRAPRVLLALAVVATTGPAVAAEWNTPESRARWAEVGAAIFGADAILEKTDRLVTVEAPSTAQDATLVPVTLRTAPGTPLKTLALVIDQNPAPLAVRVRFGPWLCENGRMG